MVSAAFIFFMEAGFFLLEGGAQRKKNIAHILLINLMSAAVALVFWWFTGFAFAFGPVSNHFIAGEGKFFAGSKFEDYEADYYLMFIFQYAFCTTTTSIVSGSLSERTTVWVFLGYCAFLAGFVYPVVCAWVWSPGGWLYDRGFHDFAGTGVIHVTGGIGGMIGAIIVGPRFLNSKDKQKVSVDQLLAEKNIKMYLKQLKVVRIELYSRNGSSLS